MLYDATAVADFAQHNFAFLLAEHRDQVLYLRLNRPAQKNAMNPTLMAELAFALSYAHHTPEVWAVVLGAEGDVFCAGADLKAFAGQATDNGGSTIPNPTGEVLLGELFLGVHKPTIAVVDGPVYAGGFLLVCGCTFVVASPKASFALPEVKRGLYPMQVMASLLQILPPRKVLELCLLGDAVTADQAHALGLVTHMATDSLEAETQALLDKICGNSPNALRMGLKAFDELRAQAANEQHAYLKGMLAQLLASQDFQEGFAAFKEKRKPNWTGR
jgi:enoyl-CoA hydratase/carnithine racemase